MTSEERCEAFRRLLWPALAILADPGSDPTDVQRARAMLARVTRIIDQLHGLTGLSGLSGRPHDARARARTEPDAGAGTAQRELNQAREQEGLHGLRKGRAQCEAVTRAGTRCRAPAVPGAFVCRRHGASAPQAARPAERFRLRAAVAAAASAAVAAKGTPGLFEALCRFSEAQNALARFEATLPG